MYELCCFVSKRLKEDRLWCMNGVSTEFGRVVNSVVFLLNPGWRVLASKPRGG